MNLRDPFLFRSLGKKMEKPASRPSLRMLQVIALESQRSRLPQMAAALSYRTVFGLLPMVVVGLVAMRFFISDKEIDDFVSRLLNYAGLEAIVINDEGAFFDDGGGAPAGEAAGVAPPVTPDPVPAPGPAPVEGERPLVTPEEARRGELAETIRSLIERAKKIDYRAIGTIGAITLIYAAISMLTEIERAFNQIFRVPVGKPWRRRVLEYWAMMTLGTGCLVATFFVGEQAKAFVNKAVASTGMSSLNFVGIFISGYAITVLISCVLLLLAYMILPNTRVRVVPALAGALLAAILWEAGKWGFTQYLRQSTGYAMIYGSIALIPLFLLWIYATWAIVLFGLQVTYQIQQARAGKESPTPAIDWGDPPSGVVDPATAVAIVHAAARGFLSGKPVSMNSVVESTRAQGSVVNDLVARLVDAGTLYRVSVADDPHHIALALPPERIPVRQILELGYELAGPSGPESGEGVSSGVRAKLRDAHLQAAGSTTVADLLNGPAGVSPGASTDAMDAATAISGFGSARAAAETPNRMRSVGTEETRPVSAANSYPPSSAADTLPLQIEGASDGDQEGTQNSVGDGDPARGPGRDARVL